jgi:flagellar hook protein FlgE
MSLLGALNSAVSALNAQSQNIAMIADNLANQDTVGYKTTSASFEALVTGGTTSSSYSAGGVLVSSRSNISEQGLLISSSSSTSIAIEGNGFFPVRVGEDGTQVFYTRNGAFELNSDGYLVNNGNYLLGWRTDTAGNIIGGGTESSLQLIDTSVAASSARATSEASIKANLPADAEVGDTFTSSLPVYDSLGTANTLTLTWEKTGENSWSATFSDPVLSSNAATASGTVSSAPIDITFNEDGSLASTSPSPATVSITGWTTGAANSTIGLDLGAAGTATGLTQYSSGSDTPSVDLDSVDQDGIAYGKLSGVSVSDDGLVVASYSNGQEYSIYKIPVATFANANGLSAQSGGVYAATSDSGSAALHEAGSGGAGSINGSALESSTTDTNEEFSNMIAAQQAYSASAQVITAVNKMYDTLISAVR